MTESEGKKVLSLGGSKPKLELKKSTEPGAANAGSVRQSFSHGRSKTVAVEVKRKREGEAGPRALSDKDSSGRSGSAPRQLTQEERDARVRALRGAVLEGSEVRRPSTPPLVATPVNRTPEPAEPPTTGDTLRHRELEELRLIQEHEKATATTQKAEDEQRRRELLEGRRSDDGRMRATRIGDTAAVAPRAVPGAVAPRPATSDAARHPADDA